MRINEKCSCGAAIEVETQDHQLAQRLVEKWRRRHNHTRTYEWPTRWVTSPTITYNPTTTSTSSYAVSTQHDRGQSPAVRRKTGEENGD